MDMKMKNDLDFTILFSIIVPVYKTEVFLPKCVDSILSQTYRHFELIIVDDGSPDNCPQICDKYARSDNRIHVIHKENGGAASARNIGIHVAHGDYIIFSDSDDYWNDINALQLISEAIIEHHCDVLCTNLCKTYVGAKKPRNYFSPSAPLIGIESVFLYERYISSPCSKIIKSQLFANGQLDFVENVGSEDIDWSLRVALLSKRMAYMDISFYCYLQHDTSSSHSMTIKKLHDLKSNFMTCIQLLNEQNESTQRLLAPYIGYQYAILLLNVASVVDREQETIFLSELEDKGYFLQFSNLIKVRMMNTANRFLGFKRMMNLLSAYAKITKRGVICSQS